MKRPLYLAVEVTEDLDPGDPEVGPQPNIQDRLYHPSCAPEARGLGWRPITLYEGEYGVCAFCNGTIGDDNTRRQVESHPEEYDHADSDTCR